MGRSVATLRIEEIPDADVVDFSTGTIEEALGRSAGHERVRALFTAILGETARERAWLFLDYGDWELGRYRWVIVARADEWIGVRAVGDTHERGLDLIPHEMELAKAAIAEIRSRALTEERA